MSPARRAVALAALLVVTACSGLRTGRVFTARAPVRHLRIELERGSVRVIGGTADRVQITRRTTAHPVTPIRIRTGENMRIHLPCYGRPDCRADLELRVPPDITLSIALLDGDLTLQDTTGDLDVELLEGDLRGTGLRNAEVYLVAYRGSLALDFAAAPTWLTAIVESGTLDLRIPPTRFSCDPATSAATFSGVICDPATLETLKVSRKQNVQTLEIRPPSADEVRIPIP